MDKRGSPAGFRKCRHLTDPSRCLRCATASTTFGIFSMTPPECPAQERSDQSNSALKAIQMPGDSARSEECDRPHLGS